MLLFDFVSHISHFKDSGVLFFRTIPEIVDFTDTFSGKLELSNQNYCFNFEIDGSFRSNLTVLQELFHQKTILVYDFKRFVSHIKHRFGDNGFSKFDGKIIDLKVIAAFCGLPVSCPETFLDAVGIFKELPDTWKSVYKNVHLPLITEVIPSLENMKIIVGKNVRYTNYEIEGQSQGRMSCSKVNERYIVPHTLSPEIKEKIKPSGYNKEIWTVDYKHMEVSVLQWLSQDKELLKLINGSDFYCNLYKDLFRQECSSASRKKMKLLFLPFIYGGGPDTLSENSGIGREHVVKILSLIKNRIPDVFKWLDSVNSDTVAQNYFGRIKKVDHKYQVGNFLIQSAAATVCQHKLIQLFHKHKNIMFNIHDGYVVQLDAHVLEKDDDFYPGLKLNVAETKGV
jgi:hypothetical protein